jgi:hypothetical protein
LPSSDHQALADADDRSAREGDRRLLGLSEDRVSDNATITRGPCCVGTTGGVRRGKSPALDGN